MKWWAGIVLGVGLMVLGIVCPGCYPKTCAPNDTSCLPCPDPASTNPACLPPWQPIPIETKSPDGGTTR